MIESLLMAAPPAPEPSTDYFEMVGIPLLVAVVTAVVTSLLNNLRTRSDRLAALRLETYRELILLANRWETTLSDVVNAAARGEMQDDGIERMEQAGNDMVEQMHLLPLVARKRSVKAIKAAFLDSTETLTQIKIDRSPEAKERAVKESTVLLRELVNTIVAEGRREIRRTRV